MYLDTICYVNKTATCITLNNLLIHKFTLSWFTMSLLFKNYSLEEFIYLLIRFNTKNTYRNGISDQNTHHTDRDNSRKG